MTEATLQDLSGLAVRSAKIFELLKPHVHGADRSGSAYAKTLVCLCAEVLNALNSLADAHSKSQVQHTAWLSRNLLELLIWCEYCAASESNAQAFSRDTAKDALGFVNAFEKLAFMIPAQDNAGMIVEAKRALSAIAAAESFELDDEFKKVHEAAKELSREHSVLFRNVNVILSKFTHPTAFIVSTHIVGPFKTDLTDMLYKLGSTMAVAALDALEKAPILTNSQLGK
jgi:hypothetical protein